MIHEMIRREGVYNVIGHVCSESQIETNRYICQTHHVKLFSLERLGKRKNRVSILNTLGYSNMNQTREKLHQECKRLGYEIVNFISKMAIVLSKNIGEGNIILPGAYIGTNVRIGSGNVFYSGCVISHDINIGDFNFFAANSTVGGVVNIGSNCFVGMSATIKNRIDIANSTLIGAGAFLDHSTTEEEVVVPTKSITINKKSKEIKLAK